MQVIKVREVLQNHAMLNFRIPPQDIYIVKVPQLLHRLINTEKFVIN